MYVLDRRDSLARFSRQRAAFVDVGGADMQSEMLEWLQQNAPANAAVLAASDAGLELLAHHRADLLARGLLPMEADDEVLLAMLDKERTYALARQHGIPTPETIWPRSVTDLDAAVDGLAYPCILKPTHSHLFQLRTESNAKVLVAHDPAELRSQFRRLDDLGLAVIITEIVSGVNDEFVSYYSYIDEHGEPLLSFTKRKIRQYPPGFGLGTYHATTHDPEVAEIGARFFKAVGLRGLGNVEFKRDGCDGRLKVIECNARFTMSNELIRRSGVNLALFAYCRLTGQPTPPVDAYRDGMRLWEPINDTRAFLVYRRHGETTLFQWLRDLAHRQCFPVASLRDPMPALVRVLRSIRQRRGARAAPPSTGPSGRSSSAAHRHPAAEVSHDASR